MYGSKFKSKIKIKIIVLKIVKFWMLITQSFENIENWFKSQLEVNIQEILPTKLQYCNSYRFVAISKKLKFWSGALVLLYSDSKLSKCHTWRVNIERKSA